MSDVYGFQDKLERDVCAALGADRRTMLQLPTGGGKTVIALRIARLYLALGLRVWFLCHRRELIAQALAWFAAEGVACGLIQAGEPIDAACAVQIGSIDSLRGRWESFEAPDLVIWDEAHRMASPSWTKLAAHFPMARHLGLSATPERLDGKPLGAFFASLVCGPQPAELEAAGALAPCRLFAPSRPDLSGVRIVGGDYERDGLAERMADRALIGDAVAHYRRLADGRPALAFAVSVKHSLRIVERFRAEGIAAEHVDYQTGDAARADALRRLAAGELKILSSVELFTEGLDIGDIGAVILLRPTRSLRLYLQMVGRGRRVSTAWPDLVVLDHAGLVWDHRHPNADREWSLSEGREERRGGGGPRLWRCPECSAVHPPSAQCPECGHAYRVARDGRPEADGELVEWGEWTEGLETAAAFARRVGVRRNTPLTWFEKGMPRVGRLVPVAEAVIWLTEWRAGKSSRYSEAGIKRNAAMTPEQRSEAARKGSAAMTPEQRSEAMRKGSAARTPEQRSETARKGSAAMTPEQRSETARKSKAAMTPEQRSEMARKGKAAMTPEQRSEAARKGSAARTPEQRSEVARKAWITKKTKGGEAGASPSDPTSPA